MKRLQFLVAEDVYEALQQLESKLDQRLFIEQAIKYAINNSEIHKMYSWKSNFIVDTKQTSLDSIGNNMQIKTQDPIIDNEFA